MKKSSILVTLFLVVALVFAVSCPSGPQVSITTTDGKDIAKEATVGTALEDFTFDIEVANGAFTADAKDQELTIKGLNQFDAENDKATAKATITALAEADASTKKVTKATVTVSGFTAKAAPNGAKELTFEIPEVKADGKKYLEDTTSAIAIGGKKVSITASNPTKNVVVTASSETIEFTVGSAEAETVTFTISPEGTTWKENSLPSITDDNGITFSFVCTSATILTLTVTPSSTTVAAAEKEYEFDITNAIVDIAIGSNIVIPENYKAGIKVTVKAAPTPEKTYATATVTGSPVSFDSGASTQQQDVTITLDGAKVKKDVTGSVSFTPEVSGVTAEIKTAVAESNSITITFKGNNLIEGGTTSVTIDLKSYVDADDTHTIPENFTATVSIEIT